MGECGCTADSFAILKMDGVEVYVDVYWRECPSCEAPKSVQFSLDKELIRIAREEFDAETLELREDDYSKFILEPDEA